MWLLWLMKFKLRNSSKGTRLVSDSHGSPLVGGPGAGTDSLSPCACSCLVGSPRINVLLLLWLSQSEKLVGEPHGHAFNVQFQSADAVSPENTVMFLS